jgi:hypothetical protein
MDYTSLQTLFAHSASMKLLRARHAPMILSFLYQEFKVPNRIVIPNYHLVDRLADYLEAINFHEDEGEAAPLRAPESPAHEFRPADVEAAELDRPIAVDNIQRAKLYIESWCSEQNRYVRKYPDDKGEDVHELTPATEKVLQWLQDLEHKEFVGTESMFLDIVRRLQELYQHSADDPQHTLAALKRQHADIEAQIQEIEQAGAMRVYNDTQIKERFYEINRSARTLLADFREVEHNFRAIARSIYQQQSEKGRKKGEILGYVLDETDALKNSDQGRSFYSFWHVLMDRSRRDELDLLVDQVYAALEARRLHYPDTFLKHMKYHLLEAGKKVVDTNHLLVEKLKRALAGQDSLERKRAIELVGDIKTLALRLIDTPPLADKLIAIDGLPYVNMIMERPLGVMPQETSFEHHPTAIGSDDWTEVDFTRLVDHFEINKEELEQRIHHYLHRKPQVTLREIVADHPIRHGLEELLTYFSIASQSTQHLIMPDTRDIIQLRGDHLDRLVSVPQIIFTNR